MDTFSPELRSEVMRRIRSSDTQPELIVRSWLHARGFRFRLHRKSLPGKPDLVLAKHKAVVFVHGCFWHRHEGCRYAYMPKSRQEYWEAKFTANLDRDQRSQTALMQLGWRVFVVWECALKKNAQEALSQLEIKLLQSAPCAKNAAD